MGSRRRLGRREVNTIERDLKKFQIITIVGLVFGTLGIFTKIKIVTSIALVFLGYGIFLALNAWHYLKNLRNHK